MTDGDGTPPKVQDLSVIAADGMDSDKGPATATQSLAGSAGLMIARKIVGSAMSAVSSIVVVRCLGPDHFGQYAAGMSAFYLFTALTEFGFGQVLGMAIGRGRADEAGYARLVLKVSAIWSCLVAAAGVGVAALFAMDTIRGGTLLVLVPAIALAGTSVVRQFFYARHEVGRMAKIDLITAFSSTSVIVFAALADAPAVLLAAAASATSVVNSLLVLLAAQRWLHMGRTSSGTVRGLIREAYPIGLASFLSTAYTSIDIAILSALFPATQVGHYASAVKVLGILTIFPVLVMSVALPQIAADWSDPARFGALMTRLWHWFVSLVMPALVCVGINAAGVMRILFGSEYASVGGLLRVLILSGAIALLVNLLSVPLMAAAKARWLIIQNAVALVVNVVGNLVLAPHYGIMTAAWLTVLTEAVVCVGSWLVLRDRIPVGGLLRVSLLPLLASAGAVGVGVMFIDRPWLALALSAVLYVVVLTALHGWPDEFVHLLPARLRHFMMAGAR
ncbi:oligosaccharide flippase family protein [Actinoplanes sp. URMC 104]|uniref:oligosaccharide flippase family protein n=1 Tax=Actinoplanes sp. URMC 104 TaxID=3423409 RepID=UPI003F1A1954